ncbi:MAG TPA: rRNA maturation RNase YbeY [Thermomicrobiales bacterium]|nr:rRNA maturation RNase YbeY [Thermomicrobiales bacterium]
MSSLALEFQLVVMPGVAVDLDAKRIRRMAEFVLQTENESGEWEIALVLTTDPHLRELHRDFMGIDAETDVMTFPAETDAAAPARGGDIVVSVDRAREQAPLYDNSLDQELEFLAVHGLLHLCGWDDVEPDNRAKMLSRQTELLQEFNLAEMDQPERDGEHPRR